MAPISENGQLPIGNSKPKTSNSFSHPQAATCSTPSSTPPRSSMTTSRPTMSSSKLPSIQVWFKMFSWKWLTRKFASQVRMEILKSESNWEVWARFRFSENGQLGTESPCNSQRTATVSHLHRPSSGAYLLHSILQAAMVIHAHHRSNTVLIQSLHGFSESRLKAAVHLRDETLHHLSGFKQFLSHSQKFTSYPPSSSSRLIHPAPFTILHSQGLQSTWVIRLFSIIPLLVGWEFFAVDVSILGVRAVEWSLGLSQLQESTFQCSEVNCTIVMIFFFPGFLQMFMLWIVVGWSLRAGTDQRLCVAWGMLVAMASPGPWGGCGGIRWPVIWGTRLGRMLFGCPDLRTNLGLQFREE